MTLQMEYLQRLKDEFADCVFRNGEGCLNRLETAIVKELKI
jgi:hypothetical protein